MNETSPLKIVPHFKNEAEEREFWLTHDSAEYIDWSKAKNTHFSNLKRTTKWGFYKIYTKILLTLLAKATSVICFFLIIASSIYALTTHEYLLREGFLHFVALSLAISLGFVVLVQAQKNKHYSSPAP